MGNLKQLVVNLKKHNDNENEQGISFEIEKLIEGADNNSDDNDEKSEEDRSILPTNVKVI